MLSSTSDAVKAVLKSDPALTPADRARIMATIRNHGKMPDTAPTVAKDVHILNRAAVAKRFSKSTRFVDGLARAGILHRVKLPGRVRACGFLAADVERVMAGEGGEA